MITKGQVWGWWCGWTVLSLGSPLAELKPNFSGTRCDEKTNRFMDIFWWDMLEPRAEVSWTKSDFDFGCNFYTTPWISTWSPCHVLFDFEFARAGGNRGANIEIRRYRNVPAGREAQRIGPLQFGFLFRFLGRFLRPKVLSLPSGKQT